MKELNSVWRGWRTNCFVRAVDFVPLLARDLKLLDREFPWWKREREKYGWTGAKIDSEMKRCGQEQDLPLSSASITSPPWTEMSPFLFENMRAFSLFYFKLVSFWPKYSWLGNAFVVPKRRCWPLPHKQRCCPKRAFLTPNSVVSLKCKIQRYFDAHNLRKLSCK